MKRRHIILALVGLLVAAFVVYGLVTSSLGTPLTAGAEAPGLSAQDEHGQTWQLGDLQGAPVVVFFYPKDDTPGCRVEACAFRDAWDRFEEAGVQVLGVSGGSVEDKARFKDKHSLPFPVLADPGFVWARAFGVRVLFGMPSRVTFLLDREGKVAKVYPDVDPALHADQVLADARDLPGGEEGLDVHGGHEPHDGQHVHKAHEPHVHTKATSEPLVVDPSSVFSCDAIASFGLCQEHSGAHHEKIEPLQDSCEYYLLGKLVPKRCPKERAIATCTVAGGEVWYAYSQKARRHCKSARGESWQPIAPKPKK